jgi:hypothetical protein
MDFYRLFEHSIGPIFDGQESKKGLFDLFGFLTLEDGTDRVSRNSVRNYHCSLCDDPEGRSSQTPHVLINLNVTTTVI